MPKNRSEKTHSEPLLILKGDTVEAEYADPEIESYRDNPLIEALPDIWPKPEVVRSLSYFPPFKKVYREREDHLRFHYIYEAIDLFQPLNVHVRLERRFSSSLRMGYRRRNPCSPEFWPELHTKTKQLPGRGTPPRNSSTTGFHIVGMSGVGKTTGIEKLLLLYPQTVMHTSYKGRPFFFTQLVWLKIDCPHDGSTKGLCVNFIRAVDHLLGTDYYERYGVEDLRNRTAYQLLVYLQEIAAAHGLGTLVVDEIQHLNEASSGGKKEMLNFFVHLENNLGVPVVLVGTYKAFNLLTGEFRMTRRGSGQGSLVWDNMPEDNPADKSWPTFLRALQRYQYVREYTPLVVGKDNLTDVAKALYYETQGITDFAVKLFLMAQLRAITSRGRDGVERLSPVIIESVARDSLRLAQPALEALRNRDKEKLRLFEDLDTIDFDNFYEDMTGEIGQEDGEDQEVIDEVFMEDAPKEEEQEPPRKRAKKYVPGKRKSSQKRRLLEDGDLKDAGEFLDP